MSIEFSRKPTPASVGSPALVSPSTDNAIVRFDGVAGLQQNSGITIDDTNLISHPKEGDQFKLSSDPSIYREGAWDMTTSGDLYTLVGTLVMKYQSHNVAVDVSGNFAARDEDGEHCQLYTFGEGGILKYYTTTNTTGVPSFVKRWQLDPTTSTTSSGAYTYTLESDIADSASAVGFIFNTTNLLSTTGNTVVSFRNNSSEIFKLYGGSSPSQSGISIGSNTVSNGGSAIGGQCIADQIYSFAVGFQSEARQLGAVALGYSPYVSGLYGVGIGYGPEVTGSFATGIGQATVSGSTAIGIGQVVAAGNSVFVGGTSARGQGNFSVTLGRQITTRGLRSVTFGTGASATGYGNRNTINSTFAVFLNDAYPRLYANSSKTYIGSAVSYAGTDVAAGVELITNGSFTGSASGWTVGAGWAYSANAMTYNSASGTGTLEQSFSGLTPGRVYRLSYTWTALTGSDDLGDRMTPSLDLTFGGTLNDQIFPVTTKEFFVAEASTHTITFTPTVTTGPLTGTLDNVSVQECQTGSFSIAGNFSARWASLGGAGTPSAYLTLGAGTTVNTPISFTSGSLKTVPVAGDFEFVADDYYVTITTGAARKKIVLDNGTALTATRVPYATTNGRLNDSSLFTFDGSRLSPNYITLSAGTASAGTSPIKFTSGTLLTTPEAGAMEYLNGHWYLTNGARHAIDTSAGIKTSTTTVTNTVTETTVYSYTFSADELHVDEMVEARISGVVTNASAADDYTINFKVGGTTIHTINRVGGNVTNAGWEAVFYGTIRTAGASGTFIDFTRFTEGSLSYSAGDTTTHSIDTTTTVTFEITVTWAAAKTGNSFSCTQGFLTFKH